MTLKNAAENVGSSSRVESSGTFSIFYQWEGEHLLKGCPELEGGIGLVDEKYEWVSWRKGLHIDLIVVDK